jgi:chromosome segregation ATPase
MSNRDYEMELTERRKDLDKKDEELSNAVTGLKQNILANRDAVEDGNRVMPELRNQGEDLKTRLLKANQKLSDLLQRTNDWTIYYVLIIEFVLFVLVLFL